MLTWDQFYHSYESEVCMKKYDIKIVDEKLSCKCPDCRDAVAAWQRIKTALGELGAVPNSESMPCLLFSDQDTCRQGYYMKCDKVPCLIKCVAFVTLKERADAESCGIKKAQHIAQQTKCAMDTISGLCASCCRVCVFNGARKGRGKCSDYVGFAQK